MQLTTGGEQVLACLSVHRTLGSPGSHHRVQLVDEEDQLIRILADLIYDL